MHKECIKRRVFFISEVIIYPGGDEMNALALNGYLIATGEIKPKSYL